MDEKNSIKGKKKGKSGGFQSFGLSYNVLGGVMRMGYKVPTPVQRKAIPIALQGQDLVCMARTGSGKTAAFLIPMLERLKEHSVRAGVRGIILSPTRELAIQTMKFAKGLNKAVGLRFCLVVGGDSLEGQFEKLSQHPDIVIATPGRLMHLLQEVPEFTLKSVEILIFDEADRLFEMGFAEQLNQIIKEVPEERQTLLFSATLPSLLVQFARAGLREPQLIRLDTDIKISPQLCLSFFTMSSADKPAAFIFLMRDVIPRDQLSIVFVATKHHAEFLYVLLSEIGIDSSVIYGAMDQESRTISLEKFKKQTVKVMIVTDVAARGIDIPMLNNVMNYSFPPAPKLFVHRVGRAARQGRSGVAYNLVDPEELPYMIDLHLYLGRKLENTYCTGEEDQRGSLALGKRAQGYELQDMTPDMVHFGCIPQAVLDLENEFCRQLYARNSNAVGAMYRVSENAMQQFRRTRIDPSKNSIRRAKEIIRNEVHPMLTKFIPTGVRPEEMKARSVLMDQIHEFRPKETVFEVKTYGTGSKKKAEEKTSQVMHDLRKDHYSIQRRNFFKAEQEKLQSQEQDGSEAENGAENPEIREVETEDIQNSAFPLEASKTSLQRKSLGHALSSKKEKAHLSKALRKKLKKQGLKLADIQTVQKPSITKKATFKDEEYYIGYGGTADQTEQEKFVEGALQPKSDLKDSDRGIAHLLEESLLDIHPDTAQDMRRKKQILKWDKRKKKYVKTSIEELAMQRGAKKLRTESGAIVNKKMVPTGEIYRKWKAKSNREITAVGIETDDADENRQAPLKKGKAVNAHVKEELKNPAELRKEKKRRREMQLKNLPKKKRQKIMQKQKEKRKEYQQKRLAPKGKIHVVFRK